MYSKYIQYVNIKYTWVNIVWFNKDQLFLLVRSLELSFEKICYFILFM